MIGIIGAMEEEVSQLIEAMEEKEKVTCAGMDFYCGKLKDKEVVIVQSGIGKVNIKTNRAAAGSALWRKHPVLYPDCIIQYRPSHLSCAPWKSLSYTGSD